MVWTGLNALPIPPLHTWSLMFMLTEPVGVCQNLPRPKPEICEGDEIPSPIRILVVFSEAVHSPI
jgi:hypothetical protein